jgi:hypothetical protein
MTDDGDQVQWQGRLHEPAINALYRTHFNAIDVKNKLVQLCVASPNNLVLKIWLSTIAISLANAYLIHLKKHKLTTEEYPHGDFKMDVVRGLLAQLSVLSKSARRVCPGESTLIDQQKYPA